MGRPEKLLQQFSKVRPYTRKAYSEKEIRGEFVTISMD